MSRFADPTAVKRVVLGDCECPGKPHDEDWMDVRASFSATDLVALENDDPIARLKIIIAAWNLNGDDGLAPIDEAYLSRLQLPTIQTLNELLGPILVEAAALPNGSGAPSANGSRGSASPIRTIRKRR